MSASGTVSAGMTLSAYPSPAVPGVGVTTKIPAGIDPQNPPDLSIKITQNITIDQKSISISHTITHPSLSAPITGPRAARPWHDNHSQVLQ